MPGESPVFEGQPELLLCGGTSRYGLTHRGAGRDGAGPADPTLKAGVVFTAQTDPNPPTRSPHGSRAMRRSRITVSINRPPPLRVCGPRRFHRLRLQLVLSTYYLTPGSRWLRRLPQLPDRPQLLAHRLKTLNRARCPVGLLAQSWLAPSTPYPLAEASGPTYRRSDVRWIPTPTTVTPSSIGLTTPGHGLQCDDRVVQLPAVALRARHLPCVDRS